MLFQTEAIRPGLWRIWDVSHTAFYLVEGQNAAGSHRQAGERMDHARPCGPCHGGIGV